MKKQKITKIIETADLQTQKTEKEKQESYYIIKSWEELTDDEKRQEIDNNQESIYQCYQEDLVNIYESDLDYLKEKYKNISFDYIYLDGNSQGNWIDSVKNFKYYNNNINIYGEDIELHDIDLHIHKYIENITTDDLDIYTYYLDDEKLEKIQATKKYQNFINKVVKDINNWIDEANEIAKNILSKEYYIPYNLNDPEDRSYLDNYFYDSEFTYPIKEADYENFKK